MGFVDLESMQPIEPVPGCRLRTPFGQHLMLSYLQMDTDAKIPMHHHPHEQAGSGARGTRLAIASGRDLCLSGRDDCLLNQFRPSLRSQRTFLRKDRPMHSLLGQCFRRFEVPPHRLHCNATAASGDAMTVGQRRSF